MKRILAITMILCAAYFKLSAQQINAREYYFDKDPGAGKGIVASLSARDSSLDTFNISTTGLGIGFHRLYVRYRYNNGSWGIAEDRVLYIYDSTAPVISSASSMSSGEYFIDTDPGAGSGIALPSFTAADTFTQNLNIPTTGLKTGYHRLYVRYRDLKHNWGIPEDRVFYINSADTVKPFVNTTSHVFSGEYFIDNITTFGAGTVFKIPVPADSISYTLIVSTTGLAGGTHQVYFHFKDSLGHWGFFERMQIAICSSPLAAPVLTGKTNYCTGDSIKLSGASVTGASNYFWKGPNGFSSTTLSIYVANADSTKNSGMYSLYATRSGGTACDTSNIATDTVIIYTKPVGNAGVNQSICSGSSVSIGSKASGSFTYSWVSSPAGFTSTIASPTVSPTVTTTYTLTVANKSGCGFTSSVVVTVNTAPNNNSGNSTTVCAGSSTSIGAIAIAGDKYVWTSSPVGFTSTIANPTVSPTVNTKYYLTETNIAGCSITDSVTIGINPIPSAFTGSSQAVCNSGSLTIGGNAVGGNTYSWTSNPAGFSSTISNPNVTPSATTTYSLTETITATGCSNSATVTIFVNPEPLADVGNPQTICSGDSVKIGATAVNGDNYSWTSFPVGFTSTLSNPYISPTEVTTYTLTETVGTCTKSNTVEVNVNLLPSPDAGLPQTICSGTSVTIGSSSNIGSSYSWASKPSGFTSNSATATVKPLVTTGYGLTETINATGCHKTDSVFVTVNPLPVSGVGSPKSICLGGSTTIGLSAVNGYTYSWTSNPAGFSSVAASEVVSPTVNTVYRLAETDATTGCINADSVKVSITAPPAARVGAPKTVCIGSSTTIGLPSVGGYGYNWTSNPSGFTSVSANPTVSPKVATTYRLIETITSSNCSSTDSVKVSVVPLPNPKWSVNYFGDITYIHSNDSSLTNTAYHWDFGDGVQDSASGHLAKHLYPSNKTYDIKLKVTNSNGCVNELDSSVNISVSGIYGYQTKNLKFDIYPNPFQTSATIEYQLTGNTKLSIALEDINGKEIFIMANESKSPGRYKIDIDASKYVLNPGIYMLKFITTDGFISKRIINL